MQSLKLKKPPKATGNNYLLLLKQTKGTWGVSREEKIQEKKRELSELKASKRRKNEKR